MYSTMIPRESLDSIEIEYILDDTDVTIAMLNSDCEFEWERTLGEAIPESVLGLAAQPDGLLLAGTSIYLSDYSDVAWLLRLNFAGDTIGYKTFENDFSIESSSSLDVGFSSNEVLFVQHVNLQFEQDGSELEVIPLFSVLGRSLYDDTARTMIRLKIASCNFSGDILWKKDFTLYFEGEGRGVAISTPGIQVEPTSDGGWIIVGHTKRREAFGYSSEYCHKKQVWRLELNERGDSLGAMVYDAGWKTDLDGCDLIQTVDGGYVMTGVKIDWNRESLSSMWLMKTDSKGNVLWERFLSNQVSCGGFDLLSTPDSSFFVLGYLDDEPLAGKKYYSSPSSIWLLKVNSLGDTLWSRSYTKPDPDAGFYAEPIMLLPQGNDNYVIVGDVDSDYGSLWLVGIDDKGNVLWQREYYSHYPDFIVPRLDTTGFIAAGTVWRNDLIYNIGQVTSLWFRVTYLWLYRLLKD